MRDVRFADGRMDVDQEASYVCPICRMRRVRDLADLSVRDRVNTERARICYRCSQKVLNVKEKGPKRGNVKKRGAADSAGD